MRDLGTIYGKYRSSLLRKAVKRGMSQEAAEDLLQDTLVSLLSKPNLVEEGLTALLTKSFALNLRSRPRRQEYKDRLMTPIAVYSSDNEGATFTNLITYANPESLLISAHEHFNLVVAMTKLQPKSRESINNYLEGKPHGHIFKHAVNRLQKVAVV